MPKEKAPPSGGAWSCRCLECYPAKAPPFRLKPAKKRITLAASPRVKGLVKTYHPFLREGEKLFIASPLIESGPILFVQPLRFLFEEGGQCRKGEDLRILPEGRQFLTDLPEDAVQIGGSLMFREVHVHHKDDALQKSHLAEHG